MSFTFTKLFSSITESTVWCEPDPVRIVWITMLAMSDRQGRVWASIPGLANRARVSIADCQVAIDKFLAPDPYSRTPDHEGRRIEPIDGGWQLINHSKYVGQRDEESRRTYQREWLRKRRQNVSTIDPSRPPSTHADADIDTDKKKRARKRASRVPEDFEPDKSYAKTQIPDLDVDREIQKFRDWEFKTPRSDWPATWRTWIGRCRDSGNYAKRSGGASNGLPTLNP